MQTITKLIRDCLGMPDDALKYELSRALHEIFPDKYMLETEDYDFDLKSFVQAKRCSVRLLDDAHVHLDAEWIGRGSGGIIVPKNSFQEVRWSRHRLKVLTISFGTCDERRHYIISNDPQLAKAFFARVCAFSSEVQGDILVFRNGCWIRDRALLKQIEQSTFEDLILSPELSTTLTSDIAGFFESREVYDEMSVAWKRGVLMLGPPGNGKTHAIKAMIHRLKKPCLYVRSFKPERGTVHTAIASVFYRARQAAPCMLVLEDIDTLVDKNSLSFFLNEMDGFAANRGVLTIATTNHPEKLDSAILDRPSRFDRKIHFSHPAADERRRFLERSNDRRQPDLRLTPEEIEEIVKRTQGFSFAYLKELILSATMVWMQERRPGGMAGAMQSQIDPLRKQMRTKQAKRKQKEDKEDEEDECSN